MSLRTLIIDKDKDAGVETVRRYHRVIRTPRHGSARVVVHLFLVSGGSLDDQNTRG